MVAHSPIPSNETARLEALYSHHILDTPPDQRFDLFTRLSTWLFNVPLAAINLIDAERTFYKSLIGMPLYEPLRSTSLCAHAVSGTDPLMVIEDLSQDSRFCDHPLLTLKGMRFYAGAILHSASGHRLGTLCIGDRNPRVFDPEARQRLLELALGVGAVLDLHRNSLQLLRAASQDQLTGLCNRGLFMERLQVAIGRARADEPCALLCLDLDGFKTINDTLGHAAGDAVLIEVGRRITSAVRLADTVARLSGDEFAVLLRGPTTRAQAEQLAQRVLDAFTGPYNFEGQAIAIRGSIGLAVCACSDLEAANLMRCADMAMYEAKRAGSGRFQVAG
jgi:diguanylate cyclase (GGDEF)-like protein